MLIFCNCKNQGLQIWILKSGSIGRAVDPDSIGFQLGSRRTKLTNKIRKKWINFMFWRDACSLWRAEGFSCSLKVFHEGLRIQYIAFYDLKNLYFFLSLKKFRILVIKNLGLDPDPDWIRIRIHQKLDPDPDSNNPDPQLWFFLRIPTITYLKLVI